MDMVVETDSSGRFARSSEVLGKGASKTVYKAFDRIEGREVAWNQALLTSGSMEAARGLLHTEVKVLNSLKHRNIMKFYASWVDDEHGTINFITEYFHSGTLKRHRLAHKSFNLNLLLLKRWAWQILQGLVYLHGHNPPVIHRDLKCDNIFIHGVSGVVKIGDLGLARLMEENLSMCHTCIGTPEFMAPELYKESYNEKVDIYSFGMCILELVTMTYPYSECKTACQIYRNVTEGIPPEGLAAIEDLETREFIKLCTRYDHERRPSARQLVKHKYFDNVRPPSPSGKLFWTASRPELAMDSGSLLSETTQESMPTLAECQSAPERFGTCMTSDASIDEAEKDGLPFVETISDADECLRRGSKQTESVASAGDGDAHRPESVMSVAESDQSLSKRQFSLQHKGSTALPFVDVVNFELCFGGPGATKKLMFSFDVLSDTVEDVGLELEEEYSLTPEETDEFTTMLKQELERVLRNSSTADKQPHVLGTFGTIQVSMSLDDWTNNPSSSQPPKSHRSGEGKAAVRSGKGGPMVSFKINVERSMSTKSVCAKSMGTKSMGVKSMFTHSLSLPARSQSARSMKATCAEAVKRKKSPDGEVTKKRKSPEQHPCRKGSHKNFASEKPGGVWDNLLQHLRSGTASLRQHSLSHKRHKLGRLCSSNNALSTDESVQSGNCTDGRAREEEDGRLLNGVEAQCGGVGDVQQAPPVHKRKSPLNLASKSINPVLNQARMVASAVKHIKAAACVLCRNSLEGKKVFFEVRRKSGKKGKALAAVSADAAKSINEDKVETAKSIEEKAVEGAKSIKEEVVEAAEVLEDSAQCGGVPEEKFEMPGCSARLRPAVLKGGNSIFRPLRKAAKRALWPWGKQRRERV